MTSESERNRRIALAVMARAPSDDRGKRRLLLALGTHGGADLRRAILLDTLDIVHQVAVAEVVVLFTPVTAEAEFAHVTGGRLPLIPQRGVSLGERLEHAFADVFARGYRGALVIGSDLPTLPPDHVNRAISLLNDEADPVVLGPARDGGYYLIGLRHRHPELFRDIPWSTGTVLEATVQAAKRAALSVALSPPWYDIDSVDDLRRAIEQPMEGSPRARQTEAWVRSQGLTL